MATAGSIGRRKNEAIERIEAQCAKLSNGQTLVLPRKNRFGADMLLIAQLTAIADFLEALPQPSPYKDMTVKQLEAEIKARKLEAGAARTKSALTAILEAADEAAEEATNAIAS